jgi:succinoglycan biosynthesis protein ExoL
MTTSSLRILTVLPVLGQPRDSKRIDMLVSLGFDVSVAAFNRAYHSGRVPSRPTQIIGTISHGKYLQRIGRLITALPKLRRAMRGRDIVYASSPDMALLAMIAGVFMGKKFILEVGDVREIQTAEGLKGRLVRIVDRVLTNRCSLLVVTAVGFLDNYYRNWLRSDVPAIVVENKIEASLTSARPEAVRGSLPQGRPFIDRPLRIGYFGLLRCQWTWDVLKAFALKHPKDVEIVMAGYPMEPADIAEQAKSIPNVIYSGEYKSPNDLPRLYGAVDLVWACYKFIGPRDWNLKWARPNRFYESCYFGRPLISRLGSSDSKEVDRLKIGFNIRTHEISEVVAELDSITAEMVEQWRSNSISLPNSLFIYTDEAEKLKSHIEHL